MEKILMTRDLSDQGFLLTPHYNAATGLPMELERQDYNLNALKNLGTLPPEKIGSLEDFRAYSNHGYNRIEIQSLIKVPQSDVYYLPQELEPFREAIQAIIDYEHNATPAAFTRTATIAVRHNCVHATHWHFDGIRPQGIRTYNVADWDPTRFAVFPLNIPKDEEVPEFISLWLSRTAEKSFNQLSLKEREGFAFQSYDITRHGRLTYHRGGYDPRRTLVSIFYSTSPTCFPLNNPMMESRVNKAKLMLLQSAPEEKAAELLSRYKQGQLNPRASYKYYSGF